MECHSQSEIVILNGTECAVIDVKWKPVAFCMQKVPPIDFNWDTFGKIFGEPIKLLRFIVLHCLFFVGSSTDENRYFDFSFDKAKPAVVDVNKAEF